MTLQIVQTTMTTPLGPLRLLATDRGLRGIYFEGHKGAPESVLPSEPNHPVLSATVQQLEEYFAGRRRDFALPLDAQGTDFQRRVWRGLRDIPFGRTSTYGDLARLLDSPGGSRAVGAANGRNPLSIVVPCHRVVGGNGKLTGYAGGLTAKEWLLRHEGVVQEQLTRAGNGMLTSG
jgi:methylated-DNA-[protein]-cysteine S-methyltransferase